MNPAMLSSLKDLDPQMADLVEQEKARQFRGIELIASEVRRRRPQIPSDRECAPQGHCGRASYASRLLPSLYERAATPELHI